MALHLLEPRLKPQGNTFVNQACDLNDGAPVSGIVERPAAKALQRSKSFSGYIPYRLQAKDLPQVDSLWHGNCKSVGCSPTRGMHHGVSPGYAAVWPAHCISPGSAAVWPAECGGPHKGLLDQTSRYEDSALSTLASTQAPSDLDVGAVNAENPDDTVAAWPDTDDEDEKGCSAAYQGGTALHGPWPCSARVLQETPPNFGPTDDRSPTVRGSFEAGLCGVADARNHCRSANPSPVSSPGGFTRPWPISVPASPAISTEQPRFWVPVSPSGNMWDESSPQHSLADGPEENSPTAKSVSSWLQALRRARDGTSAPSMCSPNIILQPGVPVPPCSDLTRERVEAAVPGTAPVPMQQPGQPLAAEAQQGRRVEATSPAHHERFHAAGAAPSDSPLGATRSHESSNAAASRAAQRHSIIADSMAGGVTTLMVRNLPLHLSQQCLMEELNMTGHKGLYDFCYSPLCSFDSGKGKGFAFVNFTTEVAAQEFVSTWHGTRRFGIQRSEPALNISAAAVQGKAANVAKWGTKRAVRIRNPKLRPFIQD